MESAKKRKGKLNKRPRAVISRWTQNLESWIEKFDVSDIPTLNLMKEIFDELQMIADFLRDNKLEEGRLNYLIADIVEMVQDIMDLRPYGHSTFEIKLARDWMRQTRMRMIKLGVEGDEPLIITTENLGEENEEVVVGLEEDVQLLLRREILSEEESLRTVLVKGMVGIGKTALARRLYNHPAVVDQFKRRAWVSLSSDLTNKDVLVKIIQQVVGSDELHQRDSLLEKMDNRSLREMLRLHLEELPYFIVVDNVQKGLPYLKYVLKCLPYQGNGSRLLITSRSREYVNLNSYRDRENPVDYIHEMKALDPDKSWQLFMKTINEFTSGDEQYKFPKHLEKKGKEMMKKCGGLPLAIIDVGRRKAKQRVDKGIEWEELLEIDAIDLSPSMAFLESSYRELDEKLQACFLYVAFFKENTIIRAKKLEQIWVASGGFAKGNAESFVITLSFESFVEVVDEDSSGRIKRCRVNPLLHRLSIITACEEMGFEILRNLNENSNGANSHTSPCRHRVIHCGRDKFNPDSMVDHDKHLVSLIFHGGGSYLDDSNWKRFEQLKILDLEDFGLKTLSETIGNTLMELKYLGLRNNYIQEIPRSLGRLKKLEVLDISQNFMVEVPDIILEMSDLHHLHMSDVICRKPLEMDMLEQLETLTYISVYDVLGLEMTLTNLKRLGIEEVDEHSDVSKLFVSLGKMQSISCLTLRGSCFRSMPCLDEVGVLYNLRSLKLNGLISRLPSADNFPEYIRELSLINSCLDEDPMPVLDKLSWLTHLKLQNAYTGRQMVIRRNGLRFMRIKELWNLRSLRIIGTKIHEQLEIINCPYLETLPEEIWSMDSLELKMVTTKKIATKIRKSGLIPKRMAVDISP